MSAKALEKALQGVPDTPTSADVFRGLWSFAGETLGGLSPPITFTSRANGPDPEIKCSYEAVDQGGHWVAPRALQLPYCKP